MILEVCDVSGNPNQVTQGTMFWTQVPHGWGYMVPFSPRNLGPKHGFRNNRGRCSPRQLPQPCVPQGTCTQNMVS